ncbi:MAG: hypothetical protein HY275_17785 [Gemmatimonadetes bacterium]|nr:hypothetical protein [Gemmatimonadota bacterium]
MRPSSPRSILAVLLALTSWSATGCSKAQAAGGTPASWLLHGCATTRPSCYDVLIGGAPGVNAAGAAVIVLDYPVITERCVASDPTTCWHTTLGSGHVWASGADGVPVNVAFLGGKWIPASVPSDWSPLTGTLDIIPCCDPQGNGANVGHAGEVVKLSAVAEAALPGLMITGLMGSDATRRRTP